MAIKKTIETILDGIPKSFMFDSHFIIDQLIKNHSDEYIKFVTQFANGANPTLTAHQMIGHEINSFKNDLVTRQEQSWSVNIHGNASECALWQKI